MTQAVGLITHPRQAEEILQNNQADLIAIGREALTILPSRYMPPRCWGPIRTISTGHNNMAGGWCVVPRPVTFMTRMLEEDGY